mgnify:CR=1 FL=1
MAKYIDSGAFIEAVKDIPMWGSMAAMLADSISVADVAPVVHSYWEHKITDDGENIGICHNCKYPVSWFWEQAKYCPNCGAAMSGTAEKGILHECKYKHPDCLCNRCRRDCDDCCLYGGNGDCPISECSSFEPEEVPSDGEKA